MMTDKELSAFGEKLYESVLFTPLPAATVFNLALAVREAIPWSHLPQHLKFAVFKIAANCTSDAIAEPPAAPAPQSHAGFDGEASADAADPLTSTGPSGDAPGAAAVASGSPATRATGPAKAGGSTDAGPA